MREKGFSGEYPVLPVRAGEDLRLYISAFRREYSLGASRDRHKLRHLTALICDELIDAAIRGDIYTGRDRIGYRRGIRSAAEFFRNNFKQPISLDGIAEMCGISRNYFTSGFRRLYGVTPLVYLTGLRITEAKRLLETTNNTVGEIAAKCGYTHANSFTQAFRMTVGINPSEYRRSKR